MFFGSHHSSQDYFPQRVAGFCFLLQEVLFSSLEREFSFTDSAPFLVFLLIDFDLELFWDYVRDGFSENYKNDILWQIVLRTVKVRDSMKKLGVY